LTKRQKQVLILLARGWEHREIAKLLHVRPFTIRNHIQDIAFRLGARNIRHSIALALLTQIIPLGEMTVCLPDKEDKT